MFWGESQLNPSDWDQGQKKPEKKLVVEQETPQKNVGGKKGIAGRTAPEELSQ